MEVSKVGAYICIIVIQIRDKRMLDRENSAKIELFHISTGTAGHSISREYEQC